jgi:hypothetical protein
MSVALIACAGPQLAACVAQGITTPTQHAKIDALEAEMRLMTPCVAPVEHFFTPGLYCRRIEMAKGSLITSKIHRTEHPYFVLAGKAAVWDGENGVQIIRAPYMGITKPGTRRVLLIGEDCTWVTVHQSDNETVEEIEARIIEPRDVSSIEQSEEFLQIDGDIQKLLSDALQKDV